MMIDTMNQTGQLLALSDDFFSSLRHQEDHQDKFTAVRRSVISFVERLPQKSCDSGWTYDHSLVFNTITSEVGGEAEVFSVHVHCSVRTTILLLFNNLEQLGLSRGLQTYADSYCLLGW